MSLKIEIGDKFTRLTVLEEVGKDKNNLRLFLCQCDCGNLHTAAGSYLKRGRVRSCGCYGKDQRLAGTQKHGMKWTRTYTSWEAMLTRCNNPNFDQYFRYGGAGVQVCDRWDPRRGGSFENFYEDMGERPEGMTLNRINSAILYSKETCEWADLTLQARDQKVQSRSKTGIRGIIFEACCARKSAENKYWWNA